MRLRFNLPAAVAGIWLGLLLSTAAAVSFDLYAHPANDVDMKGTRCLHHWVPKDILVKGSFSVELGASQTVNAEIYDDAATRNEYFRKTDVTESKFSFRTQAHAEITVCFHNVLAPELQPGPGWKRQVNVQLDFGAEAEDYLELAKKEKLKPFEVELKKYQKLLREMVDNLEHLKRREERMRNTNESTHQRVWMFSLFSIIVLCSVGVWQVLYLRRFFQSKKLI